MDDINCMVLNSSIEHKYMFSRWVQMHNLYPNYKKNSGLIYNLCSNPNGVNWVKSKLHELIDINDKDLLLGLSINTSPEAPKLLEKLIFDMDILTQNQKFPSHMINNLLLNPNAQNIIKRIYQTYPDAILTTELEKFPDDSHKFSDKLAKNPSNDALDIYFSHRTGAIPTKEIIYLASNKNSRALELVEKSLEVSQIIGPDAIGYELLDSTIERNNIIDLVYNLAINHSVRAHKLLNRILINIQKYHPDLYRNILIKIFSSYSLYENPSDDIIDLIEQNASDTSEYIDCIMENLETLATNTNIRAIKLLAKLSPGYLREYRKELCKNPVCFDLISNDPTNIEKTIYANPKIFESNSDLLLRYLVVKLF